MTHDHAPASPQTDAGAEAALALASAGYPVFPVLLRVNPVTGRKMPRYFGKWREHSTTDPAQIADWAERLPDGLSWGIDCGKAGIVVVDLDIKDDHDAAMLWANAGHPVGGAMVITPSGGVHYYFRQPEGAPPIPNSSGAIARGVDVRGDGGHVFAPGSQVLGTDWDPYALQGQLPAVEDLPVIPAEVVAMIPTERREPRERREPGEPGGVRDASWIRQQMAIQRERILTTEPVEGAGFRSVLMGAAMVYGRAVSAGLQSRDKAETTLELAVEQVWGQVDADDRRWIAVGLDDGEADPWTVRYREIDGGEEGPRTVDGGEDWDEEDRSPLEVAVEREEIRRQARRIVDARERDPFRALSAADFLGAAVPEYLVPGAFYRDSTAKVFGPPGGTKSFWLLDLALSLATGREWNGEKLTRTRVHYVMAEGQAVNVARTLAWLHHHRISATELDGWWTAVPEGVQLTPEGMGEYLALVEEEQPGFVVLDTKNAMMVGDEISGQDVSVMVRAMRKIRDTASGACVVLVDHTGLRNEERARGSNAVTAAMDTEIRVSLDHASGLAQAEVTRDKDAEPGQVWAYRLESVPGVPGLGRRRRPPAVVVPAQGDAAVPFGERREWWEAVGPELIPDAVAELHGNGSDAARDIFRVLLFMREDDGVTAATILRTINLRPGATWSEPTARRGRRLLEDAGVVVADGRNFRLADGYGRD
jgi:hypothetical protein